MQNDFSWESLVPFEKQPLPYSLKARCQMNSEKLCAEFQLTGDVSKIIFPNTSPLPKRCDDLWLHTCFEIFVQTKSDPQYWEFNFSPSGDWASYHFAKYRKKISDEKRVRKARVKSAPDGIWTFETGITNLAHFYANQELRLGLTAVIELTNGEKNHFALSHKNENPDFHQNESFILETRLRSIP